MKRLLLAVFALCLAAGAYSEQITRIGIIDIVKVYQAFFTQSVRVRQYKERVDTYNEEIARLRAEIVEIESQKLVAHEQENTELEGELEITIRQKNEYLDTYTRVNKEQLRLLRDDLAQTDEFFQDVYEEIEYVAEQGGYSLILSRSLSEIFFHTPEIDITEKVIQELYLREKSR